MVTSVPGIRTGRFPTIGRLVRNRDIDGGRSNHGLDSQALQQRSQDGTLRPFQGLPLHRHFLLNTDHPR
jgi:hypothetical protein